MLQLDDIHLIFINMWMIGSAYVGIKIYLKIFILIDV